MLNLTNNERKIKVEKLQIVEIRIICKIFYIHFFIAVNFHIYFKYVDYIIFANYKFFIIFLNFLMLAYNFIFDIKLNIVIRYYKDNLFLVSALRLIIKIIANFNKKIY